MTEVARSAESVEGRVPADGALAGDESNVVDLRALPPEEVHEFAESTVPCLPRSAEACRTPAVTLQWLGICELHGDQDSARPHTKTAG